MNFETLVQKADLALADLASGGLLQPEQSNTFFRKIIDAPTILNQTRFVPMARPKMEINKIGFGSRILRAANQGTISSPLTGEEGTRALARADRIKPTLSKITLETKEVIAEINLPYEVLEDNIEGGNIDGNRFQETVLTMIAEAAARDLEEKLILGDTASGDTYLALQDGILKQAVSNIVNHNNATISATFFKNMINALPDRYKRFLTEMKFFTSRSREIDYRLVVANRQTALGDALLTGTTPVSVLGVPLQGASQIPNAQSLLTVPRNIVVGLQRDMRMEFDKDIRERVIIVVLTMRLDHLFEEEDMVVKGINIG